MILNRTITKQNFKQVDMFICDKAHYGVLYKTVNICDMSFLCCISQHRKLINADLKVDHIIREMSRASFYLLREGIRSTDDLHWCRGIRNFS